MLFVLLFLMEEWNKVVFYSTNTNFVSEIPEKYKNSQIIIFHPILGVKVGNTK